ncbi:MAG TPA: hypothetical protein PK873_14215 [Pseudomonas sp.]|uniref:DUF7210 family protein n=1 Tax=Pseudomonas sp. TaxID=306 RepID=UPI002C70CF9B|nr:hypothetical protein [Pseudomonas sp.]HRL94703.1 hypothetical protein [Pseudomonas sp.]
MTRVTSARTTQQAATDPRPAVKVKLLKPHTHAGVEYEAGADIEVDGPTQDFLIKVEVIEDSAATTEAVTGAAE